MPESLAGQRLLITGGTRGIGLAIALRAAADGASIAVLGKTVDPHPRLPGTLTEAAEAITAAGGRALAVPCDLRDDDQTRSAVESTIREFGGLDILINNASAIFLAPTLQTPMKRFDLMHSVNVRATYHVSQLCLPYLKQSLNPHILCLAPPLEISPRWFGMSLAYALAKYGMSLCVAGLAEEFRRDGIAVNALWPKTGISTAAVQNVLGGAESIRNCRRPEIVADAAWQILTQEARSVTGAFFVDEDVLREAGVTDFDRYAVEPGRPLMPDFFLDEPDLKQLRALLVPPPG